jgi:hypothetical protein
VPTVEQIQSLKGRNVALLMAPEAGGGSVEGRLVGTLDAADGLVVIIEPSDDPAHRFSCNYQHIATIEAR